MGIWSWVFWASLTLSTGLAVFGIWQRRKYVLVVSGILSFPFSLLLFGYPASHFFLILPILHLMASLTLRGRLEWARWFLLALIIGCVAWFLSVHFGAK